MSSLSEAKAHMRRLTAAREAELLTQAPAGAGLVHELRALSTANRLVDVDVVAWSPLWCPTVCDECRDRLPVVSVASFGEDDDPLEAALCERCAPVVVERTAAFHVDVVMPVVAFEAR